MSASERRPQVSLLALARLLLELVGWVALWDGHLQLPPYHPLQGRVRQRSGSLPRSPQRVLDRNEHSQASVLPTTAKVQTVQVMVVPLVVPLQCPKETFPSRSQLTMTIQMCRKMSVCLSDRTSRCRCPRQTTWPLRALGVRKAPTLALALLIMLLRTSAA